MGTVGRCPEGLEDVVVGGLKELVREADTSVVDVGMSDSAPCDPTDDDDDDASDEAGPPPPSSWSDRAFCGGVEDWSGSTTSAMITITLSADWSTAPRLCIGA